MNNAAFGAAMMAHAAMERYYKNYLVACEYLQLDPTLEYPVDFISERVNSALSLWDKKEDDYKRFKDKVVWLEKNYKLCAGRWYGFVKKSKKYADKGLLPVKKDTVAPKYSKKPLTQENYDFYAAWMSKGGLIALAVAVPVIVIVFIVFLCLVL